MLKQRLLMAASHGSTPPVGGGKLYTWGNNQNYQTAQGTSSGYTTTPAQVGSASGWATVSGGAGNGVGIGFGIDTAGKLWVWGSDSTGNSGTGSVGLTYLIPTQVGSLSTWAKVYAAGPYDGSQACTFLIKTDGSLWACGSNADYQTGLNTSTGNTTTLTRIGASTWSQVGYGGSTTQGFNFGIDASGKLWAWGSNAGYATGLNTSSGHAQTPTQVGSATNWISVACAPQGGLGVTSDGKLWSWGTDTNGELGLGGGGATVTVPTQLGVLTTWKQVTCSCGGGGSTLVLKTDGTLWALGIGGQGQLGLTSPGNFPLTLTQVGTSSNWAYVYAVAEVDYLSLAIDNTGQLYSTGTNVNYKTGLGINTGTTFTFTAITGATNCISASGGGDGSGFGVAIHN